MLKIRRLIILLISVSIFYVFYQIYVFNFMNIDFKNTCNYSDIYLNNLENLLERTHQILEKFSLTHFLCYGSLWGQIRMGKLLPWHPKGEICIFNDELMTIDEAMFISAFFKNKMNIKYVYSEGFYRVEDKTIREPSIELYVFEKDNAQKVFKRVGFKRRVLPPHCDWTPDLDCFPDFLIQKPLPKRQLGNKYYHVPMGGIEIQKYHYVNNWWKEIIPKNCNLE